MDVQAAVAIACTGVFLTGLLFLHLGIRSKASFASLVSFGLFAAWIALAHWAVHLFFYRSDTSNLHRMGQFSSHPAFDTANNIVICVLMATFCLSFLTTGISVSKGQTSKRGRA